MDLEFLAGRWTTGSRRGRQMLTVSAMLAGLSIAIAAPAQASLPELGRCVPAKKVKHRHPRGAYTDPNCTRSSKRHRGQFEWAPGPGASNHFTAAFRNYPELELTGNKELMTCYLDGNAEGEYTGPNTLTIKKLVLRACSDPTTPKQISNGSCQNVEASRGELSTKELAGELGFINSGTPTVGVDLKPASGSELAMFECGGALGKFGEEKGSGSGTFYTLEGSVIGEIASLGTMSSNFTLKYAANEGRQVPESLQFGAKDTLTTLEAPTKEPTTFILREQNSTVINEEPLEIKAKV